MNFKGKVVIVTGAGGGIGGEASHHLAKLGANVSIVDLNETCLKELEEKFIKSGLPKPLPIVADITKDPERIINETIKHFGRLDVLVNNAGVLTSDTTINFDPVEFDRVMNVNLRSAIILTNLAVRHLEQTKGNIVNISSVAGLKPCGIYLSYCISKAGMNHFTKCAAMDLATKGIRVNAINPGVVRTQIYESIGIDPSGGFLNEHAKKSLVSRVGEVTDISSAIAFLASESFINGILLSVDGGLLCGNRKIDS